MIVRLSVCLSVTHRNRVEMGKLITKRFSPSSASGNHTIPVLPRQTLWQYSDGHPTDGDVECWGTKNRDFFTDISLISKIIQDVASYYGIQIGNRTLPFEWYHFQWPWATHNPDLRSRHYWRWIFQKGYEIQSYNEILMRTYTCSTQECKFEWPWVTFSDMATYCMIFIARPLYDSWAYCKGPFIATQLNSTRRRVELSCVAINGRLENAYRRDSYLAVEFIIYIRWFAFTRLSGDNQSHVTAVILPYK